MNDDCASPLVNYTVCSLFSASMHQMHQNAPGRAGGHRGARWQSELVSRIHGSQGSTAVQSRLTAVGYAKMQGTALQPVINGHVSR
jgi:limonene-1,2-epoxide hydrolase